eukprot:169038-Chlamydomonas_euryale.AAC.1
MSLKRPHSSYSTSSVPLSLRAKRVTRASPPTAGHPDTSSCAAPSRAAADGEQMWPKRIGCDTPDTSCPRCSSSNMDTNLRA